jgi:methylglutaconyl-CoA hydratase
MTQTTAPSENFTTLIISRVGALATVTLNRPEVRNAFNEIMIAELTQAFASLGQDASVRAIVLAANGPAFCAGADLNWMKKMATYSHDENFADALQLALMLRTIYQCPKPTVARVHGDCYAGGMGLVTACDMVVAAAQVNFCLSEVKLGLIPATISPYVIKAMGEQMARRYFLTAERFSATSAWRFGMVHELVESAALDADLTHLLNERVASITDALLANSPHAVAQAKVLVREVVGQTVDTHLLDNTAKRIAQIRSSPEGREGVASFLEKRKPSWLAGA